MKGCLQWNPVYDCKDSRLQRRTARSGSKSLTYGAVGLLTGLEINFDGLKLI